MLLIPLHTIVLALFLLVLPHPSPRPLSSCQILPQVLPSYPSPCTSSSLSFYSGTSWGICHIEPCHTSHRETFNFSWQLELSFYLTVGMPTSELSLLQDSPLVLLLHPCWESLLSTLSPYDLGVPKTFLICQKWTNDPTHDLPVPEMDTLSNQTMRLNSEIFDGSRKEKLAFSLLQTEMKI